MEEEDEEPAVSREYHDVSALDGCIVMSEMFAKPHATHLSLVSAVCWCCGA